MPELSIRKIIEKTLSGEIRIPSFQHRSDLRPLLRQRQPGYPENSGHRPERQGL